MKPKYWAYFHASRGGSWSYSNLGAGSYDPKPGSVEGWRFESGTAGPTTKPPSGTSAAQAPVSRSGSGGSSSGSSGGTAGGTGKSASGASSAPTASTTAGATESPSPRAKKAEQARAKAKAKAKAKKNASASASASASTSASAAAGASDDTAPAAAEVSQNRPDDGSGGLPWWVGVLGVVLLGGVAGGVTLARRKA